MKFDIQGCFFEKIHDHFSYKRDSKKQLNNFKFAMKMTIYNTALENSS